MAAGNQSLRYARRQARHQLQTPGPDLPNPINVLQSCPAIHHAVDISICVTASVKRTKKRCWNINQLPIDYAIMPRLRGRLTRRGVTFRRNPWAYGVPESHRHYRYSCLHSHFPDVQCSLQYTFIPPGTLLYRKTLSKKAHARGFGVKLSSIHFRRRIARSVSYYALFKGWLLLGQPPGCLNTPTSFPT